MCKFHEYEGEKSTFLVNVWIFELNMYKKRQVTSPDSCLFPTNIYWSHSFHELSLTQHSNRHNVQYVGLVRYVIPFVVSI